MIGLLPRKATNHHNHHGLKVVFSMGLGCPDRFWHRGRHQCPHTGFLVGNLPRRLRIRRSAYGHRAEERGIHLLQSHLPWIPGDRTQRLIRHLPGPRSCIRSWLAPTNRNNSTLTTMTDNLNVSVNTMKYLQQGHRPFSCQGEHRIRKMVAGTWRRGLRTVRMAEPWGLRIAEKVLRTAGKELRIAEKERCILG